VIEEFWNQGQLALADELFAADYVRYDPATPNIGTGPGAARQALTNYRDAFPDLRLNICDLLADGDKVVLRWTARGSHRGELRGIAPTGKEITTTGITIFRIADGRIAEEWVNWDTLGLLQQLGAIPT
jgi:steroid delta-isomerase-like uncharacterized protein